MGFQFLSLITSEESNIDLDRYISILEWHIWDTKGEM